ncbi:hybrid sensor histidine kinase/response regulator transcription factor [Spirosoma rhododendri]|uniref:histidine kinase n=1 Tax=Spirosoma rhododendri TaxID=2728024 RepID=A0A7L5DTJ5_9BACT|nr:two-component regulator propeller domain-containing protein [Spirosoma rhododendri]QJD80623.1 response regulator [Spirosoma rhododendri]
MPRHIRQRCRLLVVVLPVFITAFARGQHPLRQHPLGFEHLGTEQGLSHNRVFSIYQDRKGFMWFGTGNGLNRYDGYSFTMYKPDPGDPNNHMAHNTIWDMVESRSGDIWFVTPGGGLHRLNKQTGRINFFRVEQPGTNRFAPYDICYTLFEDKQGFFWIGSEGGLARFNPYTKQYRLYNIPVPQGADQRVWTIQEDRFGTLWVGTSAGLFTLNRRTGQFSPFHFAADPARQQIRVESIYLAADNSLWLGTKYNGLHRLLPKKGLSGQSSSATTYAPTGRVYLTNQEILPKGLGEDQHHNLMVGTRSGLFRLDPTTGYYDNYQENPTVANSLSHNEVWALLADNRGTFWIGTANGIDYYSGLTPRFAFYQPVPDHNATPRTENNVTMLTADLRGNLWFSNPHRSHLDGVFRLDPSNHTSHPGYASQPLATGRPAPENFTDNDSPDVISAIHGDRSGRVWVATPAGLQSRDATGQLRQYRVGFPVTSIGEDRQGRLWVGGRSILAQFDPTNGRHTLYRVDKDYPIGKGGGQVNDILVSRAGDIWAAVAGVGACKLDPRTGHFTSYHPHPAGNRKIFYSRDVLTLGETADGAIWVSTNIGGVFRIDPKTAAVSTFTSHDGLPDNQVVALIADQTGMLWMATGKELCRLDPATRKLRVFDAQDGLLSQTFTGARVCTSTGELAFGSTNGLVVFSPSEMGENPYQPPVYITQAQVLDSTRLFPDSPLTLAYRDNIISFSFVGLTYIAPKKARYAYQLNGVNSGWVYCGTQRTATYSFLAPGDYVFRVKASNNDGVWNEKGAAIRLVILPPWWRTWWAYLLYALAFGGLVLGFIRFRIGQVQQQQEIILKRREAEQLRAVDEVKTRFFSNITHEFRTPLTLILSPAETLLQTPDLNATTRRSLRSIYQNAEQLLRLINQLLDLVKLEGSRMAVSLVRGDAVQFIHRLIDPFFPMALHRHITLHVDTFGQPGAHADQTHLFDADKWEKIITNLVSNALKFTPTGGQVLLTIDQPTPTQLRLRLSDTGIGIPTEHLPHIFDRFYQVDTSQTRAYEGTGIGLALAKELTELLGGTLTVDSRTEDPPGTTFTLTLPLLPTSAQPGAPFLSLSHPHTAVAVPETTPQPPSAEQPIAVTTTDTPLVLIVDDNDELRTFIAGELTGRYRVLTATDGEEGWAICQRELPDVVLTDVMMPRMDGFQLTNCIKSTPTTNHIAVVLLTARAAQRSRVEGLERGADDYLTKPFHVDELRLRLTNLLTRQANLRTRLYQQLSRQDTSDAEPVPSPFVDQLQQIIESRLDDATLSVDELAQAVAMSRRTLHRKLTTVTSLTPIDFIRHYRLQRAVQFLRAGHSITETAYSVGFESPGYFSTVFKQTFRQTPSEFLAQQRP